MPSQPTLGQKIKMYRKRAGLTQFDLELDMDISFGSVSRFENNLVNPTKETLNKLALVLDLSASEKAALFGIEFVTNTIDKSGYSVFFPEKVHFQLWMEGRLLELSKELEHSPKATTLGKALLFIELGDTSQAKPLLNDARDNYSSDYVSLLRSEILLLEDDYYAAQKNLSTIVQNAKTVEDSYLLGKAYFLLGLISSQQRNSVEGYGYMQRALEHFNVSRHAIEVGKLHLFMTDFLEYETRYEEAAVSYKRAQELFEYTGNMYLQSWALGGEAFNKYSQGDASNALILAKKAYALTKHLGSKKQHYYSTSVLAKAFLIAGNEDAALESFEDALQLERGFRKSLATSSSNLFKLFIMARTSTEALDTLTQLSSIQDPTKRYLIYTAQFLFGKSYEVQNSGIDALVNLEKTSNIPHLKSAIFNTLEKKAIQPVTT
jgi:transcriptional regulator with XRE-family HTH domain